jgi:hypothetical protein
MNPLKKWPLTSFYLLALVLASGSVAVFFWWMNGYVQTHGSAFDYVRVLGEFADRSVWKSVNIPVIVSAAKEHPVMLLVILYALAPTLAAGVVTLGNGRRMFNRWLGRLKPWQKGTDFPSAAAAYGHLVTVFVVVIVGFGIVNLLLEGGEGFRLQAPSVGLTGPGTFLLLFLGGAFLDEGGTLEEMGWRGFAHPQLLDWGLSPAMACVFLGVLWGLWHIPRDVIDLLSMPLLAYLLGFLHFLTKCVGMSLVIGYFFNRTGGSVIPAIMIHGLVNFMGGITYFPSLDLGPWGDVWRTLFVCVWAGVLLMKHGIDLGMRGSAPGVV